jgi:diguanylate cyclase (GGDEF)-like protein
MTDGEAGEAQADNGDPRATATLGQRTAAALGSLLGDAAELLRGARLIVATQGEELVCAGVHDDEELRAEIRHLISMGTKRGSTRGWSVTRHPVPGSTGLHVFAARPHGVAAMPQDDAILRVLTGAIALAVGTAVPDRIETSRTMVLPDMLALRRNQLLEVLLQIQRGISRRAPLDDVLDAVVKGASLLMDGDAAMIHLVDSNDANWLTAVASTAIDDDWHDAIKRVRMGDGASGRAALEQQLVVFDNYREATGRLERAVQVGVAAAMAAPVHTGGQTAGSIVVATRDKDRRYSAEDRTVLLAFADNVSLALTDAHNIQRVDEALHDAVTGLPTRTLFLDRLDTLLTSRKSDLAVLFCDLDRFKRINDSLGHAAGDTLLHQAARRLSGLLRPTDTAARLGGDEFAVLLEDVDERRAEAISARIVAAFAEPFTVGGHVVRIGISIGLAPVPAGQGIEGEQLLSAADIAMYRAKRAGGSGLRRFEPTMAATAVAELALENDLQRALPHGELDLVYQPVFDLWADRVAGVETLLRWTSPRRGPVATSAFVRLAEESGLIIEIGRWVIDAACATMRTWQHTTGRDDVDLGVNLSARQFGEANLVHTIERSLDTAGIDPARFVVEITESTLLADVKTAVGRLHDVRALGVRVALDDFGTGYSSLSYLRQLPIDYLKIDRAFLPDSDDDRDWALTATIVRMASDLGMVAIAEGIETEQQLARLLEMGCPDGQGYFLARPVPGSELMTVVDRHLPPTRRTNKAGVLR